MTNSKDSVQELIEQTNVSVTEHKDITYIEELFEQLFTNPSSFSAIFLQLTDICHSLVTNDCNSSSFAFDIFNIILKKYLKLLDIDQFIDEITHSDSIENNKFLRQYFSFMCHYNIGVKNKTARDLFYFLFDQMNSSKRIISYLQYNISNDNQKLNNICSFIIYIILKIVNDLDLMLTNNDLVKYQDTLFNLFLQFIDQYFIKKQTSRQQNILIEQIRLFILKRSHITPAIPILINAHYPEACLRWLSLSYLDSSEYQFILHVLYNIARHDEGVSLLNKSSCATIVRQYKNKELNMKLDFIINDELRLKICRVSNLILALVVDPDELYSEEINSGIIKHILLLIKMIFEKLDKEYHISEILIILMKLCTNDDIIDYIFQQDQYPTYLFLMLNKFLSDIEKDSIANDFIILSITALTNIFWSISFNDQYKNYLIQNINFIKRLDEFRETSTINNNNTAILYIHIPYQMSSLKRAIDGIWQNLNLSKLEIKPILKTKRICSLMISYSQVNINFCQDLYNMLNKLSELTINVDFINGKYSWKEIIEIIEQSNVILFLLSKEFYYSKTCRQEFLYVTNISKNLFFPIFIDKNFKSSGWLHKHVVRLKSIYFGEKTFINTCEELLNLINENLSINLSLINNSLNINKWNDEEIKQWFINNHIKPELYEFYHFKNGHELLLYATATLAFSWTKEYERIKLRFEEKFKQQEENLSQEQFLQFIYALKRLSK